MAGRYTISWGHGFPRVFFHSPTEMHAALSSHTSVGPRSVTVRNREMGTGISESIKRDPIFLHDVRGGKQVSSYFGQELRQTQENWEPSLWAWQGSDPAATIVA